MRGPFFDEDDAAEIDVLDYNVDTTFTPDRFWMEGRTRLRMRVRAHALSALTLRLADSLVVRSVSSDRHRRLLHVRVRNQNSLVVNLPEPLNRDDVLTLTISSAGRHEPQGVDRENMTVAAQVQTREVAFGEPEPIENRRAIERAIGGRQIGSSRGSGAHGDGSDQVQRQRADDPLEWTAPTTRCHEANQVWRPASPKSKGESHSHAENAGALSISAWS